MSTLTSEIRLRIRTDGDVVLNQLSARFNKLASETTLTKGKFNDLATVLRNTDAQVRSKSINTLQDFARSWRELANSVDITSKEFRQATAEAQRFEAAVNKAQGRRGRGGLAAGAQILGTVASAGIFGGPAGFLGAAAGGITGGVQGALVGGALGATTGGLTQAATGSAEYAAEIGRLRLALKGVSTDQQEFNKSLDFIQKASSTYLSSLGDTTRNYTRLQASVRGAGLSVKDTQTVFNGLSAAVVATGGNAESLNATFTAASQVFSKGKVTAEELRGQIGERLPGAFSLFAQAVKMTPQQLDEALKKGQVTLSQFVTFGEALLDKFGKSAQQIGDSPYAAGIRFQLALDNMRLAAGTALLPIITAFQNLGTSAANSITRIIEGQTAWQKSLGELSQKIFDFIGGVNGVSRAISALIQVIVVLIGAQAGLFVATNINNFATALGNILRLTRELLNLERIRLVVNQALAGAMALVATLESGAGRKKIAGMIIGAGVGVTVAATIGKVVEEFTKNSINNMMKAIQGIDLGKFGKFGGAPTLIPPGTEAGGDGEQKKAKKILDISKEEIRLREQIRQAADRQDKFNEDYLRIKLEILNVDEKLARKEIGVNDALETRKDLIGKINTLVNKQRDVMSDALQNVLEQRKERAQMLQDMEIDFGLKSKKEAEEINFLQKIAEIREKFKYAMPSEKEALEALIQRIQEAREYAKTFGGQFALSFAEVVKASSNLAQNLGSTLGSAFVTLGDQLANFVTTGKLQFADFAKSVLSDLTRIFIRFAMFEALRAIIPGGGMLSRIFGFANGGIMTAGGPMDLRRYASGGIANSPQLAMFGEGSRPEAYVPLPDGRTIPVTMSGGAGVGNVTVNVDANGSNVEGNGPQANALGKAIGIAVQQELIKQKRPGGLLA